jgi:hypothetical protein
VIRRQRAIALPVLLVALSCGYHPHSAAETYYRWVDDRGNPVHSDRPPPQGIEYEVVSTDTSLRRPVEADQGAVPKQVVPTASNDFEPVEPMKLTTIKNPEYCARARENLETIDVVPRIRTRDDQGEMRILTPEDREAERQKALAAIEAYCE